MPDLSRWLNDPGPAPPEAVGHALEPVPGPAAAAVADAEGVSYRSDGPGVESAAARYPTEATPGREAHGTPAAEHLAAILERTPRPDWHAEHAAAVELVARACPTEREADRMRSRRSARSLVGFKPIADLDRHELARDTLALLLAVPAVAAGGMVLWTDYADDAGHALEAARAALRKPVAGQAAGTPRAA